MIVNQSKKVQIVIEPTPDCFEAVLGKGQPDPFGASLDETADYNYAKKKYMYELHKELGQDYPEPQRTYLLPEYHGFYVMATAFGAPMPQWSEGSACWWHEEVKLPWNDISSVKQVEDIPIPDWKSLPLVKENIQALKEYRAKAGNGQNTPVVSDWAEWLWTNPNTNETLAFSNFPTFINFAPYVMGATEFFTLLAMDHEVSNALLKKCFKIIESYNDFTAHLYGYDQQPVAWGSLGGDPSCLLSPDMYREYAMSFDQLAREKFGNVPRNLHSCGASVHLYEVWSEYAEKDKIVVMQTRAVADADLKPLRKSLPHTYIELTICTPQIDFENETPGRIKELAWKFAEDLDFRDMSITVLVTKINEASKANMRALFEATREIDTHPKTRN